jgi:hypothetical protein
MFSGMAASLFDFSDAASSACFLSKAQFYSATLARPTLP